MTAREVVRVVFVDAGSGQTIARTELSSEQPGLAGERQLVVVPGSRARGRP